MLNLIKMEFFRALKSKCTYVLIILIALFSILNPIMLKLTITMMNNSPEMKESYTSALDQSEQQQSDVNIGMSSYGSSKWYADNYEFKITDMSEELLNSGFVVLSLVIFTVIFVSAEIKHGYVKNMLGQIYKREKLVFANGIICILMMFAMTVISIIITSLTGVLLFNNVVLGDVGNFCQYLLTKFLLYIAFASLIILLSYLVRSSAFAMVIGICLQMGIGSLVYLLISTVVNKVFKPDSTFSMQKYTITGNISAITQDASEHTYIRAIIVALIYCTVFTFLACTVAKKRDLK